MPLSSSSEASHCSYSPSCAWDQFSLYSQFLLLYKKSFRGNHSVSWDVNELSFYLFLRWIHSLYDLHRWRHQFPNEVKILLTIRSNPANIAQPRRLIKTRLHYAGKTSFFSVSTRAERKPKVGKLCTTLVFRIVYKKMSPIFVQQNCNNTCDLFDMIKWMRLGAHATSCLNQITLLSQNSSPKSRTTHI